MAWNKAMRAWASAGPERKHRGDIYRDGWMRITTRCGGWSHTRIYYVTAVSCSSTSWSPSPSWAS